MGCILFESSLFSHLSSSCPCDTAQQATDIEAEVRRQSLLETGPLRGRYKDTTEPLLSEGPNHV